MGRRAIRRIELALCRDGIHPAPVTVFGLKFCPSCWHRR